MSRCNICGYSTLESILKLGPQPVSSHFKKKRSDSIVTHDVSLSVCSTCGVVQLANPFPFTDLISPYEWITYREPEDHLDDVVKKVISLAGDNKEARILGLTFKDQTTLTRLNDHGFSNTGIINAAEDLGAGNKNKANIESVQALLTPQNAEKIVLRSGTADILIVRHILEHAEDVQQFMAALEILLTPGGHAIIEVPDCQANLRRMDYTMIWEEHVCYFTEQTLPQVLRPFDLEYLGVDLHPYSFENVLILYACKPLNALKRADTGGTVSSQNISQNLDLARQFGEAFSDWTDSYVELFNHLTRDGRRLAAYGAGHLTCAFLNFHNLADYFAFVIDDTAVKQGLFLPGSDLPIVARDRLNAEEISMCVFGLAPEIEDKLIAGNHSFANAGGKFASIFADSPRSLRGLLPD